MLRDPGSARRPSLAWRALAAGLLLGLAAGAPGEVGRATAAEVPPASSAATPADAADPTFAGEVIVILENAAPQNYRGGQAQGKALHVHLTFQDGACTDAWGTAPTFNQATHDVYILDSRITRGRIRMRIDVDLRGDLWVAGGKGTYTFDVGRRPSSGYVLSPHEILRTENAREELQGTHRGTYKSPWAEFEAQGTAVGVVWPPRPVREGFVALRGNEHPRFLFRKQDLPALRQRTETPLGRAIVERLRASDDCIAQGTLYQLTGDKAHAAQAYQNCVWQLTGPMVAGEHETHQSTWQARRTGRGAIGYDLACDGWTEGQRTEMASYLENSYLSCLYYPYHFGGVVRPGTKADRMYGGGGLAVLALWGTPGPAPPAPERTIMGILQKRFGVPKGPSFEELYRVWQVDYAFWKDSGGASPKYARDAAVARHWAYLSALAVGEGGTGGGSLLIYDYAVAHENMFGTSVTGRGDLDHAAIAHVMDTVWREKRVGDGVAYEAGRFVGGERPAGDWFARAFAAAPASLKPALWWYWLRLVGTTPEEVRTDAGARRFLDANRFQESESLVHTLAQVGPDLQPEDPAKVLPHVWENKPVGQFAFRDGWNGTDSIVARFFGYQRGGCETGSFEIYGLGETWINDESGKGGGVALEQFNHVEMPDDPLNLSGAGVITDVWKDPRTGSGTVSLNMDKPLLLRKVVREMKTIDRSNPWVQGRAVIEGQERTVLYDAGLRGMRAFAADYTGKSGAPALFVVVDRIAGGGRKEWVAHLPNLAAADLKMEENSFAVSRGGAMLQGTFVAPAAVRIERVLGRTSSAYFFRGKYSRWEGYTRDVLQATGADPTAGDFLLVMTLQRGPAPPMKVEGTGLAAKVTVGQRTIAFDGERIILGD